MGRMHYPAPLETGEAYDKIADWVMAGMSASPCGMPFLEELAGKLPENAHVLELGCGFGRMTRVLLDRGFQVTALDVSEKMIRLARDYVPEAVLVHGDASEFCSAETYDAVLAWDSLFHLPPERQRPMMERISALLKPGGILLMTSGMKEGYASGLMSGVMFHYSTLSQGEYRRILERNHLVILKMIQDQPPEEHLVTFARKRLF